MKPLPYTNGGAGVAFYALLGAFALLELRGRIRSLLDRSGSRADRGSLILVYVAVAAGLLGAFALAVSGRHPGAIATARWPVFVAGLIAMGAGIALRQWAVAALGRFFTFDVRIHSAQTVIEHGPYRWLRHPSYTGLLLTLAGIGLALGNWASLAALVIVPTAALVVRIRVEERALLEGLGEPYRRFAATRARLIPGVW